MRLITLKENDIRTLFESLKLEEHEIKARYKTEHSDLANTIHRGFHLKLVRFFQEHGSSFPVKN